jgi:hypothetical protein
MRLYRASQRMQRRLTGAVKATHICPASWVLVVSVLAVAMGLSRADAAPCYYQGDVVSCFSDSKCYSYCDPCAGTPYCFDGQCGTSSVPLDCNDHNDCTSDLCIQDCTDPFWTGQGLHCQPMFSGSPFGTYGCIHKPIAGCAGPTSTPGRTATVRSTLTPTRTPTRANTPTHTLVPTATPPPPSCTGDCDGSGEVTVNEIITLVNIGLGNAQPSACPHGVPSGTEVDIALIIQAVNNALNGCA